MSRIAAGLELVTALVPSLFPGASAKDDEGNKQVPTTENKSNYKATKSGVVQHVTGDNNSPMIGQQFDMRGGDNRTQHVHQKK